MRALILSIFAAAALFGANSNVAEAAIDPTRVHVVDTFNVTGGRTFFVRGNSPFNKDTKSVEYDTWMQAISNTVNASGYAPLPPNNRVWLVDICLENIFDKGFFEEQQFFVNNPTKGAFVHWELLGAPLWPSSFTDAQVKEMISTGSVWKNDQIPERMVAFRRMLQTSPPEGYDAIVYYAHCAAGCDRTGEFVASYRIAYKLDQDPKAKPAIGPIFEQNCKECGRCPNWYSAGATGWYCMTVNFFNRTGLAPLTDCFTAFTCEPLGDCKATGI